MTIKTKILDKRAKMPTRGSGGAAGHDLYALIPNGLQIIKPHETEIIKTGIAVEIPQGYFGGLYARSGLATNSGLRLATGTSVIDSDYRGEVLVGLYNDSNDRQVVYNGDRIAQLVIQPHADAEYVAVGKLSETDRGKGGFGSTGVK